MTIPSSKLTCLVLIPVALFWACIGAENDQTEMRDDGDSVLQIELKSAPLRVSDYHQFEVEICVCSAVHTAESFPEHGKLIMQAAFDRVVGSTRRVEDLYAEDLGEIVRRAINTDAGDELAKKVTVTRVSFEEHAG